MKTLLRILLADKTIPVGDWDLYAWIINSKPRGITCRHRSSGLMGPTERPTASGLSRLLRWIDERESAIVLSA